MPAWGDPDGAGPPFESPYRHGFVRVAVGVPRVRVADPQSNAVSTIALARRASDAGAALVVFPELGISAYSNEDLFHQQALSTAALEGVREVAEASRSLLPLIAVGAPLVVDQRLFNTAVVIHRGRVLGVVPKSHLPNYREYYEKRQFCAARDAVRGTVRLLGRDVPFGPGLIFEASDVPDLAVAVEICEDLWAPIAPSTYAALAGATVLANLSASNVTVDKPDYRRQLCGSQSARAIAAYLYGAAGPCESTTDLAWDGHALVYENGDLLAEGDRYGRGDALIAADVDLDRLVADRMRTTSFADCASDHRERVHGTRRVAFELHPPAALSLERNVARFPFVPADRSQRDARCEEVYRIQVQGLATRLSATTIEKAVIGVSGGLDSTHALFVAARAMDELALPRTNVLAYSLPGFATSRRTRDNAHALMRALGVTAGEIDIRPSATQMLRDLGHAEDAYDITYENVQAGERTSHLFRLANQHRALVVGTGDLSELALGWCTYGVGDQMAHYSVNASVPKTLIRHLVRWAADTDQLGPGASAVLRSILDTPISPELIPHDAAAEAPAPDSETVIGPFELQDFFLYYVLRFGYRPSKVAYLAHQAWGDRRRGTWPDVIPADARTEYRLDAIEHWLEIFLDRFFRTSQFKRSALPNAPKVGSGGSLSPRGDWRAPSDASARVWLDELRRARVSARAT